MHYKTIMNWWPFLWAFSARLWSLERGSHFAMGIFCFSYRNMPHFGCITSLWGNHIVHTLSRGLGNNSAVKSSMAPACIGQGWEMGSHGCSWPFPGYRTGDLGHSREEDVERGGRKKSQSLWGAGAGAGQLGCCLVRELGLGQERYWRGLVGPAASSGEFPALLMTHMGVIIMTKEIIAPLYSLFQKPISSHPGAR